MQESSPKSRQAPPAARLATATQVLADLQAANPGASPGAAPVAPLRVLPQMALTRGRVHELTGPARRTLAAVAAGAAQAEGPVLWLRPDWRRGGLYPLGLAALMPDPGALILAGCSRAVDVLWGAEEALRAGCVALVVAEIAEAPDLRQIRRLHLAAAEGVARSRASKAAGPAPLGLLLAFETARSSLAGVESRWALHPLPAPPPPRGGLVLDGGLGGDPRWRLERLLARGAPPAQWEVETEAINAHGRVRNAVDNGLNLVNR